MGTNRPLQITPSQIKAHIQQTNMDTSGEVIADKFKADGNNEFLTAVLAAIWKLIDSDANRGTALEIVYMVYCLLQEAAKNELKGWDTDESYADLTEPEIEDRLKKMAWAIERWLPKGPSPGGKALFAMAIADEVKIGQYLSNADKRNAIQMMKTVAKALEDETAIER